MSKRSSAPHSSRIVTGVGGAAFVGLSLALSLPAAAQSRAVAPSATGWYTGFGAGQARLGFKTGDFAVGPAATTTSYDDTDLAFKFFAGYRILPWLAVEGGYDNLGRSQVNYSRAGGQATLDYRVDGLKLTGVGSLALGNTGFAAFGKVGFGYARVRAVTANFPAVNLRPDIASTSEWKLSPVFGAGLQYQLPRGLALRAEYEQYTEVGDSPLPVGRARAGLWSLSLMYLF